MEQLRMVETEQGVISYLLRRKRIKNLNLRVDERGTILLSIPVTCPLGRADEMVRAKVEWILAAQRRMQERQNCQLLPEVSREECRCLLGQAVMRVFPLIAPYGVEFPELRLRKMRSQWGNCHWMEGYITLNTALARCPEDLRDYVALHELVHFLHHDHGPGFQAVMSERMPDWKRRRQELKRWSGSLTDDT